MTIPNKKKIWIDLENSPHVPFFKPIIKELNARGYAVFLTARDCAQTCGLADLHDLHYKRIGRHYGKNKILKVMGMLVRVLRMLPLILKEKPCLALAHGSRSQLILAWLLRMPSIATTDYEHTRGLPIARPKWLIVPEVLTAEYFGVPKSMILRYPGIKEDIYVSSFKVNGSVKEALKISETEIMVTVRPPATEAHYFVPESGRLFESTIDFLGRQERVRMVVMPRNENQKEFIETKWRELLASGRIIIPGKVVDGLNLIWWSDLVISGGGTMNREAAALGVPVYSIFRGTIGAVDRHLADSGRLVLLESAEDLSAKLVLKRRRPSKKPAEANSSALQSFVGHVVSIAESTETK